MVSSGTQFSLFRSMMLRTRGNARWAYGRSEVKLQVSTSVPDVARLRRFTFLHSLNRVGSQSHSDLLRYLTCSLKTKQLKQDLHWLKGLDLSYEISNVKAPYSTDALIVRLLIFRIFLVGFLSISIMMLRLSHFKPSSTHCRCAPIFFHRGGGAEEEMGLYIIYVWL